MAALDRFYTELVEANPDLRARVGNPDELASNRLGGVLKALKHRVSEPESELESVSGRVITALNEEAVVSACLANQGGLNLVASYEAFCVKMLGAVRQTQALIDQKAIRAPFSGQLGIRRVHLGQYLGVAEPVASLVDARTLKSNFSLDESTSPELKLGQPLEVLVDAYPGRSFPARISAIDPLIGKSRTVQVQALLDNPEGLLAAGMFASIRVSRKADAPSLSVPETAVTYTAYGDTVFVAHQDGDRPLSAKRVSVRIGERWDGRVEILQGLAEGDRVVTSGQINLSDGMAVEPVKEDTLSSAAPPVPVAGR
ncbi:efflux RND transporter periplasmic adaptor subunit [Pseudomonas aeruginosa]|uniref:efflux RND transporter periplasmic adaptor subunit n=1 Tax=Pseudomonas aeruginosa TaxID=287 RepID=UPI001F2981E0|nr:efflux RND transporter periplasmic adaptor subunit [Pseudomonas aeruginosa]